MSFIGNTPTSQSFISGTDYFNGTGSQTAFTLTRAVNSVNDIEVVINNVVQQPSTAYTISGTTITFTSAPSSGTANIYVRYLSTTTQTITPSQGTVGWNQLTSDVQQDLGISFKNRIINGAMVIDQRNAGASVTQNNSGIFTLDRWFVYGDATGKFTVQQNASSVTPPVGFTNYLGCTSTSSYTVGSGEIFVLQQMIEGYNIADLGWGTVNAKTVTLSFWVRSSLTGTFGGSLKNNGSSRTYPFSYTISAANTWEQKSITIAGDTSGTWLTTNGLGMRVGFSLGASSTQSGTAGTWSGSNFTSATGATSVVGTSGATFYITGVQLEVGSSATGFEYRQYGTELALCQRYCFVETNANAAYRWFAQGYAPSGSTASVVRFLPVQMRTPPSFTTSGAAGFIADGPTAGSACTAITDSGYTTSTSARLFLTTSGMTTGHPILLASDGTTNLRTITYSAEL